MCLCLCYYIDVMNDYMCQTSLLSSFFKNDMQLIINVLHNDADHEA